MKKGVLILIVAILIGITLLISYFVRVANRVKNDSESDAITTSKVIPNDYMQLLGNIKSLSFEQTIISKRRNPIAQFNYRNKFRINVYRVNQFSDLKIGEITTETYLNNHISYGLNYNLVDELNQYEILCKSGFQDKVSKIYINLYGDDTRIISKNDTLAYYYSKAENFYIKYQPNSPQDFFGSIKEKSIGVKIPMEIMLIKRNKNIYLILLSANDAGIALKPGTLLTLLANNK
ncbi:MAG: hypothetical protein JST50_17280 [Bacteroidetes bacterium]|jgi:hypothetical protein|nr:hypothetical protein [Bacteroidota bacterium]